MALIDFLVEKGIVDEKKVKNINDEIKNSGESLEVVLNKNGISSKDILEAKSEYYKIPIGDLTDKQIPFDILKYIPEGSARHYQFVPIGLKDGILEVGMVEPNNTQSRDALYFLFSQKDIPYKIFFISKEDLEKVLESYRGLSGEVTSALSELEPSLSNKDIIEIAKEAAKKKNSTNIIEDAPIEKIASNILEHAVEEKASDVHIEPMREKLRVRFRVDGFLSTRLILPGEISSALIARFKVLSQMKLDEKRKPQDGRFSARIDNRKIDFRISTFPSYYGEKLVARILDQEKGIKTISELGLSKRNLELLRKAISRPYGLILISGPTGSGKSTTLYSLLEEIDKDAQNVLSLEDPVEYSVDGVSQSQVFSEIGYTFATGLRTTLRQDPDIIMVGEIRDAETAKLAIQAALTGHLVLSTIHTNTAAGIVPRLIDMGVDPYLIAPTLILGVAQRLVRKICPNSGEPLPVQDSIKEMLNKQFADLPEQYRSEIPTSNEFLKIKPTDACPIGTRGREAVFEMYEMTRDLEKVILTNPTENAVYDEVRKHGMLTMKEDVIIKALNKTVPFEEINKF